MHMLETTTLIRGEAMGVARGVARGVASGVVRGGWRKEAEKTTG